MKEVLGIELSDDSLEVISNMNDIDQETQIYISMLIKK